MEEAPRVVEAVTQCVPARERPEGSIALNPQVESLLLDPELMAVVNHDLGNGDAGLFALGGFFISFSVGKTCWIVKKKEVGGIGLTMGNQIVSHFLVKLRPFDMRLLDDIVDLGQRESILFVKSFGPGTAHLSNELFGTG